MIDLSKDLFNTKLLYINKNCNRFKLNLSFIFYIYIYIYKQCIMVENLKLLRNLL